MSLDVSKKLIQIVWNDWLNPIWNHLIAFIASKYYKYWTLGENIININIKLWHINIKFKHLFISSLIGLKIIEIVLKIN